MNTEKIWLSLMKKIVIIAIIFIAVTKLTHWFDGQSTVCWLYCLASLTSLLILGGTFFQKFFTIRVVREFLNLCQILAIFMFIIFLISFSDIFDGPYGSICRWPLFTSLLIWELFIVAGWIILKINEGLFNLFFNIRYYDPY